MKAFFTAKRAALVASLFLLPFFAFAYQSPGKPNGFVNDFARLLKPEEAQTLETKLSSFEKETGNEISVVTIDSTGDDTIENYAESLFKEWGIGKKGKDNGVLLLIARSDREMRIEVGYGLEGVLTDAESFHIIRDILTPAFGQGDFYGGIDQATERMEAVISLDVPPTTAEENQQSGGISSHAIFFIFFLIVYMTSVLARSKSWWLGGVIGGILGIVAGVFFGFFYIGILATVILTILGLIFDFLVSSAYARNSSLGRPHPWWMGGGGWGSGGGGFGGFGGGSSGGGGASGRW